jgi:hypothetical protein
MQAARARQFCHAWRHVTSAAEGSALLLAEGEAAEVRCG